MTPTPVTAFGRPPSRGPHQRPGRAGSAVRTWLGVHRSEAIDALNE